jgi:endonuclease/exonuclease/phosphatase family metal-dependent hydrolase
MAFEAPVLERPTRRQALATMLAAGGVAAAPEVWSREPLRTAATLRVLQFNTHLLPGIAQTLAGHRGQDDYRTAAIASKLDRYDLVGLNEVFEARRRREIVDAVQKNSGNAYRWVESPKRSGSSLVCGGLLLLSRFPFEGEPHFITYKSASRVLTHGPRADGLAAKGAIHVRLLVDDESDLAVDCFLTHLESISAKARARQVKELADFVVEHSSPERPMILMGDLNTAADFPAAATPNNSEYGRLTNALRCGNKKLVDVWAATHDDRGGTRDAVAGEDCNRIDYVFLSPASGQCTACWQPASVRVERFLDEKVKQGSLSDHAGVECELALRPAPWR